MLYSTKERLEIVLDIVKKLKNYKLKNNNIIDLYNENLCSFVKEFKEITKNYIKEGKKYEGTLYFEEINKNIEYILPINKNEEVLFVIRCKNNIS
jgi:hypothetical protein